MRLLVLLMFALSSFSTFAQRKYETGFVKTYNARKGYGFIRPVSSGGADVFVHISQIERSGLETLYEGQCVHFELVRDAGTGKTSAAFLSIVDRENCEPDVSEYFSDDF